MNHRELLAWLRRRRARHELVVRWVDAVRQARLEIEVDRLLTAIEEGRAADDPPPPIPPTRSQTTWRT